VESGDEKAARLGESSILGNKLSIAPLPIGTPSSCRPLSHKASQFHFHLFRSRGSLNRSRRLHCTRGARASSSKEAGM